MGSLRDNSLTNGSIPSLLWWKKPKLKLHAKESAGSCREFEKLKDAHQPGGFGGICGSHLETSQGRGGRGI